MTMNAYPFGFNSDTTTSISISMNGTCTISSACELFMGFGDNQRYITFAFTLDDAMIGYEGDPSNSQLVMIYPGDSLAIGNLSILLNNVTTTYYLDYIYDIRDDLSGGNGFTHSLSTEEDASWPITVSITNDVDSNQTQIYFENGARSATHTLNGTFASDSDLYFGFIPDMNSAETEGAEIYGIDVTLSSGYPTMSPTADPTSNPTAKPTVQMDGEYVLIAQHKNVSEGMFSSDVRTTGIENADDPDANTYCIIGLINSSDYLWSERGYYWLKLIYRYDDGTNDTSVDSE